MSYFFNKSRLAIDLTTIIAKEFGIEYPKIDNYVLTIDLQKGTLTVTGLKVKDMSKATKYRLDDTSWIIKSLKDAFEGKIFLGTTGYFTFGDISKSTIIEGPEKESYRVTLPFYKLKDYKNYITDINKDISLLILISSESKKDAAIILRAFDDPYTEQDYKFASKLLYPGFYSLVSDVLEEGPEEYFDVWKSLLLSLIDYKTLYGKYKDKLTNIQTSTIEEKDITILEELLPVLSIGKETLYKIITKLLVKLKYPYLYTQIKDTYTLENYSKDDFYLRPGTKFYPGLLNYLKTGDGHSVIYERDSWNLYNLTVVSLLLRDGLMFESVEDFSTLINNVAGLIEYSKGGPEFFTIFKSLTQFLIASHASKDKLKEMLSLGFIEDKYVAEIQSYIDS